MSLSYWSKHKHEPWSSKCRASTHWACYGVRRFNGTRQPCECPYHQTRIEPVLKQAVV